MLHAARCKCRTQKSCQKTPSGHHRTTLSGYIFATKAFIDNRKKLAKQQYLAHMSLQYGELRPTSGFRFLAALPHSQTAALNRERHLYSAGRPSRWALAHISSSIFFYSLPNLSGQRLDVYHTSTHSVALVRI